MAISDEKAIFLSALERGTHEQRAAYLAAACGSDGELREAVDSLLAAHDRADALPKAENEPGARLHKQLADAAVALGLVSDSTRIVSSPEGSPDRTGEQIGPYRLMEKLGEGGFGEVYVVEQQRPVRRRVALKLLKPGMGSRDVIARFEAERQALAMMEHPNIARVLDAGATGAGEPFVVMELVRGLPITEFCESHGLTLPARLELFVDVCDAVQHAHQRGVIHRDLKPSNVLVGFYDNEAVVKVIDFGVAKALGDPLTDKTLYTRLAQMIGTPAYMSPEQAELNSLDVDTRSDVYSLGVMLYELLTGATPVDQHRLQSASFDEMRRLIREEQPIRPSVKVTSASQQTTRDGQQQPTAIARAQSTNLRGDLDWIALKALEKDRRRRYQTAADFSRDVRQYMHQQPVSARPPSATYRFTRFAQRNKLVFGSAIVVLASLVAATGISTWKAIEATQARVDADQARQDAVEFADRLKASNVLLDNARANADEGRLSTAWRQYTQATNLAPEHYLTWSGRGALAARVGAWHAAADDYHEALLLGAPANNPSWWGVPQLCLYAQDAESYSLACEALRPQLKGIDDGMHIALIIRSLCLRPVSGADAAEFADRMEELLTHPSRNDRSRRPPPGPPMSIAGRSPERPRDPRPPAGPPVELQRYAAALASYRAGRYERSVEHARAMLESEPSRSESAEFAYPLLALVYSGDGQQAAAEQALSVAEQALAGWIESASASSAVDLPMPWFDFLECVVLWREAHQQIRGRRAPFDDRLRLLESRAIDILSAQPADSGPRRENDRATTFIPKADEVRTTK